MGTVIVSWPVGVLELDHPAVAGGEAVGPGHEEVEEDVAAHLAVGGDVDPRVLLDAQRLVDGCVLGRVERPGVPRAGAEGVTRLDEPGRAQHRAHHFCPVNDLARFHVAVGGVGLHIRVLRITRALTPEKLLLFWNACQAVT